MRIFRNIVETHAIREIHVLSPEKETANREAGSETGRQYG